MKFDLASYSYCALSTFFHALALSFIQKCGENEKNSIEIFYFSSLFSLPLLFLALYFSNEFQLLNLALNENSFFFQLDFGFNLIVVVCFGCFLCFSQFWCTTNNTALTTSVIGVLKSFIQTMLGIFLFKAQYNLTYLAYIGISINLIFGTWYTYLKYIEKDDSINNNDEKKSFKPISFNV